SSRLSPCHWLTLPDSRARLSCCLPAGACIFTTTGHSEFCAVSQPSIWRFTGCPVMPICSHFYTEFLATIHLCRVFSRPVSTQARQSLFICSRCRPFRKEQQLEAAVLRATLTRGLRA